MLTTIRIMTISEYDSIYALWLNIPGLGLNAWYAADYDCNGILNAMDLALMKRALFLSVGRDQKDLLFQTVMKEKTLCSESCIAFLLY